MTQPAVDEATFIRLVEKHGPNKAAKVIGCHTRRVYDRLSTLKKRGIVIKGPNPPPPGVLVNKVEPPQGRKHIEVKDGIVLVGSDSHYWPGIVTTAHRAFVKFCKELQPKAVIKNGDELDGCTISRHPPIGWENRPSLVEEIETTKERLEEIEKAAPNAYKAWPLGNHDARFETRLAMVAPEYAKIYGVHLKDHFPLWFPCWSVWINDDVVIKHRYKSGIHAPHNNTMWAGKTIVTGHLHSLKVQPMTDYNGTRWGVDCGTMAEPNGPQFNDYLEDNPVNWRSGFIVLTFHKGRLLWPEVVSVVGPDEVDFRGQIIKV